MRNNILLKLIPVVLCLLLCAPLKTAADKDEYGPDPLEDGSEPAITVDEPAPVAVEDEPAPATVEDEPAPATVEDEPAPATVEDEPAPATVEDESAKAAMEDKSAPAAIEDESAPVAVEDKSAKENSDAGIPEVVETYTGADNPCVTWYVRGLSGKLKNATAYVGTEEIAVSEKGLLGDEGGYAPKTLILVDNSASMSRNRSKIKDILVRLIWNHQNVESFCLATFDTEKRVLVDYTDNYDALRLAAEDITYKDQTTYLRNVLYNEIKNLSLDKKNNYNRIIIFSDATDDSILGITYDELTDLLSNDSTSCPIYTIGCTYRPKESDLDKLFALSRRTGSPYFMMDNYENATEIADVIDNDGKAIRYFSFDLDAEHRDGSDKAISLMLNDANGEHLLTHMSHIQLASADELKKLEKERKEKKARKKARREAEKNKAESEAAGEASMDNVVPDAAEAEEVPDGGETEEASDESSSYTDPLIAEVANPTTVPGYIMYYLSQNGLWITLFLLVSLAAYVRFAGAERKRNRYGFVEDDTGAQELIEVDEKKGITKGITLTNLSDAGVKFFIGIGQERVLGRLRSRCDIAFPEDRSMSARQALIHVSSDKAELENLDTQRGSVVDGQRIVDSILLKNGSHIRLGNTYLRVSYE